MKRFEIDTNYHWFGPHLPAIYPRTVQNLALQPGECVLVYQDEDEWHATVRYDSSVPEMYQWYLELDLPQ
jgi:hypothetical protein